VLALTYFVARTRAEFLRAMAASGTA
jgi:hypothetical protein